MIEEILSNPITGETMRVLESTPQKFVIEYALKPHGQIPLEHYHPDIEQEISVKSGEMHLTVNGIHKIVRAGESVVAPPSARHFQWNPSDTEVVAMETYRPAGRNHAFFKTLFGLATDRLTDSSGMPSLLYRVAIFSEFRDTIRPVIRIHQVQITVLKAISWLLGYSRRITKYRQN